MFRESYDQLRGYALRRTTSDEAAQDAISETYLVAWRRFDDVPADALPWLFGVARRVLANQRRSAQRGMALERRLSELAREATDGVHEDVADAELVRLAFARLSEREREALMLVGWHDLTGARAARAAGCSRAAFAVRLHRARARLTRELHGLEAGVPGVSAEFGEVG